MFRTLAPNLPWLGSQEYRAQSSRAISELGMLVRFATRILSMLMQQRQFFGLFWWDNKSLQRIVLLAYLLRLIGP
jgi:hypothetical protein